MVKLISGERAHLPEDIIKALGEYRYRIFVERLGWRLPMACPTDRVEWDEFDGEQTTYIVAVDAGGRVCGCARLLPTTKPYLLSKVFPHLIEGPPTEDPTVWELSRFACHVDGSNSSQLLLSEILGFVISEAKRLGAHQLIGVAPCSMWRLYRRIGLRLIGNRPPQTIDGEGVQAYTLPI